MGYRTTPNYLISLRKVGSRSSVGSRLCDGASLTLAIMEGEVCRAGETR